MKTNVHLIISHSCLPEIKNISDTVVEKIETHIVCSITFFPENRAFYDIMWKNSAERGRPQMTKWSMRSACWITKTTTHTQNM